MKRLNAPISSSRDSARRGPRGSCPHVEPLERRSLLAAATINFNDVRQTVDGFGASSAWTWGAIPTTAAAQLFSPTTGIGLSLLRSHIYPQGWTSESAVMQQAASYGVRNWSTPWSPPREWKLNNDINNGGTLDPARYQDYATQLADYCLDRAAAGTPLIAISLQNEPELSVSYESAVWTEQELAAFLPVVATTFAARGVTTKIVLPESYYWGFDKATTILADPGLSQYVGILAAHNYDRTYNPYRPLSGLGNFPRWQTEVYLGGTGSEIGDALMLADDISKAFEIGGASAYHYWWLSAGGYGGLMNSGYAVSKRLWAMGNYSKFVRPGWSLLGQTDDGGLSITAFKDVASGKFAVVAANASASAVNQTFTFSGATTATVTPYLTSGTVGDDLRALSPVAVAGSSFAYVVPANSVITFTGTASGAAPVQTPTDLRAAPQYGSTATQISLTWNDNSTSETAYAVERSTDGTHWTVLTSSLAPNTTTYLDTGRAEASSLRYRVRALGAAETSGYSATVIVSTVLAPPTGAGPWGTNLNGNNIGWSNPSTVSTALTVDRSTDGVTWARVATISGRPTAFSDNNIPGYSANRTYFYRLRNTLGSTASDILRYNTGVKTPTGFTAAVAPRSAVFSWTNVSLNATGAAIEQQSGTTWSTITPSSLTPTPATFSLSGLTENTAYAFRLRAFAASDSVASGYTPTLNFTTPVASPQHLVAVLTAPSTARLTWTDDSQVETAYAVERSTDRTNWTVLTSALPAGSTTYTDTASPAGATYYRVRASSGAAASAYTRTQRVEALPITTANPGTVTGTTAALSVTPLTGFGSGTLTYTWSLDGTPPAGVSFVPNATSGASSTTATFTRVGSYTLRLIASDASGYAVSATLPLTVSATLTSISISAMGGSIVKSTSQQLSASALDQFGIALSPQPTITWSVFSGGGTVNSTGRYTAPAAAGSPVVRAASGAVAATRTVTVLDTAQLTAAYSFNESSGWNVADGLGVGVTGKVSGSTQFSTGRLGHALSFDGSTTSVWLGNPASLNVTGQITLAAWIKPSSTSGTRNILGRSYGSWPNQAETVLRINGGKYEVGIWNGATTVASFNIPAGDLNTWVHLAGTYDGQAWRLYRNGTQVASVTTSVGAMSVSKAWRIGSTDIPDRYFSGSIDSVRIYSQALSAAELSALASQTIAVTSAPASATVTGTTAALSAAAIDPDSGSDEFLTYTWSVTGTPPASVSFSANGTRAARDAVATFTRAGTYNLLLTVTDITGTAVTRPFTLTVAQTPSSIAVTPGSATVPSGTPFTFSATVRDQFSDLIPSASPVWTATGGTVSATGIYTAGAVAGTNYAVTATLASVSSSATVTVPPVPLFTAFVVNAGAIQRSKVSSVTLGFSMPVTLSAGAFTLIRRSDGFAPVVSASPASGSSSAFTLSFSGAGVVGGSLPDGVYDLTLTASAIRDSYAQPLSGGNQVRTLHRLFGDINGDATVDATDQSAFNASYGSTSTASAYVAAFDYESNGSINNADLLQFRLRLGMSLFPPMRFSATRVILRPPDGVGVIHTAPDDTPPSTDSAPA